MLAYLFFVQYMYTGEVTVSRDQLPLLLKTASFFKMEGINSIIYLLWNIEIQLLHFKLFLNII